MKVDVEGAEKSVLEGMTFTKYRPWIILLESTEPLSSVHNHELWESLLLNRDYNFVYDDGLNRFYVSNEHLYLKKAFICPPNVFDNFILVSEYDLKLEIDKMKKLAIKNFFKHPFKYLKTIFKL